MTRNKLLIEGPIDPEKAFNRTCNLVLKCAGYDMEQPRPELSVHREVKGEPDTNGFINPYTVFEARLENSLSTVPFVSMSFDPDSTFADADGIEVCDDYCEPYCTFHPRPIAAHSFEVLMDAGNWPDQDADRIYGGTLFFWGLITGIDPNGVRASGVDEFTGDILRMNCTVEE